MVFRVSGTGGKSLTGVVEAVVVLPVLEGISIVSARTFCPALNLNCISAVLLHTWWCEWVRWGSDHGGEPELIGEASAAQE
jgi:hypothetical protein